MEYRNFCFKSTLRSLACGLLGALLILAPLTGSYAQSPEEEKIAAIKQNLQTSAVNIRSYEWIETVSIKLKGEQKAQKQNRCYYGDDGELHKMPLGDASEGKSPRGIRGKVAKKKKGEIKDYAEQAIALIKQYVPPEGQRIQKAKDEGKTSMTVYGDGSRLRLVVPDYLKAGDVLNIDIDPNGDRITGISVATYLEADPKDAVTLDVKFSALKDGTGYPASVVLDGQSKELNIAIENSGHRKSG